MLMKSLILLTVWCVNACGSGTTEPPTAPQETPATTVPTEEVSPPPTPPANPAPAQPAAPPVDPIHDLLDRLEKSAGDLHSFTADVQYEKEDSLLGRKELRSGNLIYKHDHDTGEKSFAILFEVTIIDKRRVAETKQYIFSGRWLAEVDPQNKQFIKREIVPPGKTLDPLKLGEGPFPLPIGQPKSEVLERFNVTAAKVPADGLLKDLQNADGLTLVPKPGGREAKEFSKVELFYDRATLLPVGIITFDTSGERKVIRLLNVMRNPELTPEQLARLDIREPDPREWRIDVRPWKQAE